MLSGFKFHIRYQPGSQNKAADALSRRAQDRPKGQEDEREKIMTQQVLRPEQFISVVKDSELSIYDSIAQDNCFSPSLVELRDKVNEANSDYTLSDGILKQKGRLVVPTERVTDLLNHVHRQPAVGHPGRKRTLGIIAKTYYWHGMYKDTLRYVQNCHKCRRTQPNNAKHRGLLRPLPIPTGAWQHITVDFVGKLPTSKGYNMVMVVVDRLTKRRHYIPCTAGQGELDSQQMAELFLDRIWKLHGLFASIVSDRGSVFIAHFWRHLCRLLKISRKLSTAYHPQTDGQTESVNKEMERHLRLYVDHEQTDWADKLPLAEFAANYHQFEATGMSPFEADLGWQPRMDFDDSYKP